MGDPVLVLGVRLTVQGRVLIYKQIRKNSEEIPFKNIFNLG